MARLGLELQFWPIFIVLIAMIAGGSSDSWDCPEECDCLQWGYKFSADCTRLGLSEIPNFENESKDFKYYIYLAYNKLKEFPRQYSNITTVEHLDLAGNFINKLDADALQGFTDLTSLSLANNSITSWQDINANVAFIQAIKLWTLKLKGNRLGTFGFDNELISFTLDDLDISSAQISTVNLNWADRLPNLKTLNMANNNLSQVRQLNLYDLRILDISNCSLQQINLNSRKLYSLILSHNPAVEINFSDNQFKKLHNLDLSYCSLDRLDVIRHLPHITYLNLQGNKLESINATTFENNTEIVSLDLSDNVIRLIESESFSSLKSLLQLNLTRNKLVHFDESLISSNYELAQLDLSHNNIQNLPKIISKSLRFLFLSWCNITTIDSSALSSLSAIEQLDLSHNLISEVPYQLESNTLQRLKLAYCRLSTIQYNNFRGLSKLRNLHLNDNQLTSFLNLSYFPDNKSLKGIAQNPKPQRDPQKKLTTLGKLMPK